MTDTKQITDLENDPPAIAVAAELGRRLAVATAAPQKGAYLDAAPYVVLRDQAGNERLEYLNGRLDTPSRETGTVMLDDMESFIAYVRRFTREGTVIYAKMSPARFEAVLNDHAPVVARPSFGGWRDFRAVYQVAHSREWMAWTKHNGSGAAFNSPESFALFLEDNSLDIVKPDAATMLKLALNFRVKSAVSFVSANRLQDGNIDFSYTNDVSANGTNADGSKLKIPETFTIEIPVFHGINQDRVKLDARFRFRLHDGKLTLWYELIRPTNALEDAFRKMWAVVKKETGVPMFLGAPWCLEP